VGAFDAVAEKNLASAALALGYWVSF